MGEPCWDVYWSYEIGYKKRYESSALNNCALGLLRRAQSNDILSHRPQPFPTPRKNSSPSNVLGGRIYLKLMPIWLVWVGVFLGWKCKVPISQVISGDMLRPYLKKEGNEICQAILKQNGTIVPRRSIRALNPEEMAITNETEARKRLEFDAAIWIKLGDSFSLPNVAKCHKTESNASEQNLLDDESFDPFVGVQEVNLPVIP